MAETPKCLAQYDGTNGVLYDLYTVPASTKTIATFLSVSPRLTGSTYVLTCASTSLTAATDIGKVIRDATGLHLGIITAYDATTWTITPVLGIFVAGDVATIIGGSGASATLTLVTTTGLSSGSTSFRISYAVAGAVDNVKQYIYRDIGVAYGDTFVAELKLTMAASDILRVYTPADSYCAFNLFGVEVV